MSDKLHTFFMIISLMLVGAAALFGLYWLFADRGQYMTNDEIIAETKKCEEAGLEADRIINGWNYKVTSVQCGGPKE